MIPEILEKITNSESQGMKTAEEIKLLREAIEKLKPTTELQEADNVSRSKNANDMS